MKKVLIFISFVSLGLGYTAQDAISSSNYTPLPDSRFNHIEDLLNQQAAYIPILIKDVPKNELITFYIQSYGDNIISNWTQTAYKKLLLNKLIEVDSVQDKKLKSLMSKEQTKDIMYQFMLLMTEEQIISVGY